MQKLDGMLPPEPARPSLPRPSFADPAARARRRAEVLAMLSRERRRQQRVEPRAVRWTGTETA